MQSDFFACHCHRFPEDTDFYDKTQENVASIIKAIIEPLISAKDNEYKLEIR